jgi:hypothetical protein
MATIPAQLGSRASSYAAPYVSRFIGNRFVGNSVREVMSDVGASLVDPFYSHGVNQGINHVNETARNNGSNFRLPAYNSPPPNTLPSLFGSVAGNYLFNNRTYLQARATQTFHGPNTNEGVNNFVQQTHDAVHFDPFESYGS